MPNREFLENYPLYRKYGMKFVPELSSGHGGFIAVLNRSSNAADTVIGKPAINMHCAICRSAQTFNMQNTYESGFERSALVGLSSETPNVAVARLMY